MDSSTFELRDSGGSLVSADVAYDGASQTATLSPLVALIEGETYTATLRGGATGSVIRDVAGNALSADVTWTNTTEPPVDATPPLVTSTDPLSGATDLALDAVVSAAFSEDLDAATVDSSTFELRDSGGSLVTADVAYDGASQTASLTPLVALLEGETYTATLQGGATGSVIRDVAGNALSADVTWTFTTVPPVDATPPLVTTCLLYTSDAADERVRV